MAADLGQIPDVDIDSDGVFKYVLIRVHLAEPSGDPARECKEIVRGYKWAEYHADIYDKVSGELQKNGYDCECLGGGRISHQSQDRKIHVYGYSMILMGLCPGSLGALGAASAGVKFTALTIYILFHEVHLGSSGITYRTLQSPSCSQCGNMGYGRAQHSVSTEKIKAKYPDYEVTWADDGY